MKKEEGITIPFNPKEKNNPIINIYPFKRPISSYIVFIYRIGKIYLDTLKTEIRGK